MSDEHVTIDGWPWKVTILRPEDDLQITLGAERIEEGSPALMFQPSDRGPMFYLRPEDERLTLIVVPNARQAVPPAVLRATGAGRLLLTDKGHLLVELFHDSVRLANRQAVHQEENRPPRFCTYYAKSGRVVGFGVLNARDNLRGGEHINVT